MVSKRLGARSFHTPTKRPKAGVRVEPGANLALPKHHFNQTEDVQAEVSGRIVTTVEGGQSQLTHDAWAVILALGQSLPVNWRCACVLARC